MVDQGTAKEKRRGHGEGAIFQRTDGRWVARLVLPNGKRKDIYAKTREGAGSKLRAAQRALDDGITLALPPLPVGDVAALPKADIHVHQEGAARMDAMVARRKGIPPHDWQRDRVHLMAAYARGERRLHRINGTLSVDLRRAPIGRPDEIVARIEDLLTDEVRAGAVLVEIRFGPTTILVPEFMDCFREAAKRVCAQHGGPEATAVITVYPHDGREEILLACLAAAREGLAGIDFIPTPYSQEADWSPIYYWAERAADVGLQMTAHVGEFSTANIAAALQIPGLQRIGHGTYAFRDPVLMEAMRERQITVECCLTSNVVLGAVASYDDHPIGAFLSAGIPVCLSSDDPLRLCTDIGREYAAAANLGFSRRQLFGFTRNAIQAGFVSASARTRLLQQVDQMEQASCGVYLTCPPDWSR